MKRVRVFIVDDAPFIRKAMTRVLSADPELEIVGEASNGLDAIDLIDGSDPDVVTLDVNMPGIDGLATLRELRKRHPDLAVVMLSSLTRDGAATTLQALEDGAVDFIDKNALNVMDFGRLRREVLPKLKIWSSLSVPRENPARKNRPVPVRERIDWSRYRVCILGASTGGPSAIEALMRALPAAFPVPIVIVQHMPVGFTRPFAERLNAMSSLLIREAQDDWLLEPGHVVVAPAGKHLRVDARLLVHLSDEPSTTMHRPSVDVTMYGAACTMRQGSVVGVLLTGMGDDGAAGMCAIRNNGGLTIAENEETSVVAGMPRAAFLQGGVERYLPLNDILDLFLS